MVVVHDTIHVSVDLISCSSTLFDPIGNAETAMWESGVGFIRHLYRTPQAVKSLPSPLESFGLETV